MTTQALFLCTSKIAEYIFSFVYNLQCLLHLTTFFFFLCYICSISKAAAKDTNIIIKRPHRGIVKIKIKRTREKQAKSSQERTKTQHQAAAALT